MKASPQTSATGPLTKEVWQVRFARGAGGGSCRPQHRPARHLRTQPGRGHPRHPRARGSRLPERRGRLGRAGRAPARPGAKVIDALGACVVPGFVDAHCQVLWEGSRADETAARLRGQPFWGGGIMRTVRLTRAVSEDRLVELGRGRLQSFLRHGVTALEAKTGYGLTTDAEEQMLRAAARLVPDT